MSDIVERLRAHGDKFPIKNSAEWIDFASLYLVEAAARIEQLEAEVKKYAMDGLLATDGNLMLHEENQRLRAALRVAAHELELLYFFAISNGIAEAGVPPHVAARAALGEQQ